MAEAARDYNQEREATEEKDSIEDLETRSPIGSSSIQF